MSREVIADGLLEAATAILRPMVIELIGQGVPFGKLEARLRELFVRLADSEFVLPNRPQTDSRISVLTGINRKEVRRIRRAPVMQVRPTSFERNLAADIVGRWSSDPRTTDAEGRPRPLPFRSRTDPSFVRLVHETTTDLRPRAILDELIRTGVAELTPTGEVKLNGDAYVPRKGMPEMLQMLAQDPPEMITTMLRNIFARTEDPHLQQRVAYDNLGAKAIAKVRALLRQKTERFLGEIDRLLARFDHDRAPDAPGGPRRYVSFGVYYFESSEGTEATAGGNQHGDDVTGSTDPAPRPVRRTRRMRRGRTQRDGNHG